MPNFTEPTSATVIAITVVLIFIIIGLGILAVKLGKGSRNPESL